MRAEGTYQRLRILQSESPVETRLGGTLRFEDAQTLVRTFSPPLFELIVEIRQRIVHVG